MIREISSGKILGIKTSFFSSMNPEKYDPTPIPGAWQEFFAQSGGANISMSDTFYGAMVPSGSTDGSLFYYAGVLVDSEAPLPDGFEALDFPAGKYFCVTHIGPITEIGASTDRAYQREFPASGLSMRNAPHLEIYESDKDPMDADYEMVIAIPIE